MSKFSVRPVKSHGVTVFIERHFFIFDGDIRHDGRLTIEYQPDGVTMLSSDGVRAALDNWKVSGKLELEVEDVVGAIADAIQAEAKPLRLHVSLSVQGWRGLNLTAVAERERS